MPRKKYRGAWVPVAALKRPAPRPPLVLPETVPCVPYQVALTVEGCAKRWGVANLAASLQKGKDQSRFAVKDRFTLCKGCRVGELRYQETRPEISDTMLVSSFLPQIGQKG